MSKTLYLKCEPGDVAERVLLTGDPARVERIAGFFDDVQVTHQNREYHVTTGLYRGQRFTAASAGIGAPSTAIALEEFKQLGVQSLVRVGTMMGVHAPMGSHVIATGAARFEGTSVSYLPLAYPAVPDWALVQALHASGQERGLDLHMGISATYDAFYPHMAPALTGHGLPQLDELKRAGVMATDMETAMVYIVGRVIGLAVASMCVVTVQADPFTVLDPEPRAEGEDKLIETVLQGLL
jgi:uridine phosphorylase